MNVSRALTTHLLARLPSAAEIEGFPKAEMEADRLTEQRSHWSPRTATATDDEFKVGTTEADRAVATAKISFAMKNNKQPNKN